MYPAPPSLSLFTRTTRRMRENAYRTYQKINGQSAHYHHESRIDVKPSRRYYYQRSRNRLFVCYYGEQCLELKKLCGHEVEYLTVRQVNMRKASTPFAEEIDLRCGSTAGQ
jgi:hypothetical protein